MERGQRSMTKVLTGLHPRRSRCLAKKLRRKQDSTLNTSRANMEKDLFCGIQEGRSITNE